MSIDIEKEAREIEKQLEEEKELEQEPSKYSKILKSTIALLLVILFVSYILVDPNVRDVIAGFFESSTVDENSFIYTDKTVTFSGDTWENLVDLFNENQATEFRACLQGYVNDQEYIVNGILLPEVHFKTVFSVTSAPCPVETIVDLHSHPHQRCIASDTDLNTLAKEKETNPDILMAVMCTDERISFYG